MVTAVIASIGLLGALLGLAGLERLEVMVVALRLSLIGGLVVVLTQVNLSALLDGCATWTMVAGERFRRGSLGCRGHYCAGQAGGGLVT